MLSNPRKLAKLPAEPGVYFFKNRSGEIIYIGKAANLKNRVKSYFQKGAKFFNAAKLKMLADISDVEILRTDSEIKALIKESELIKKHKPKFNVLMRDSKNFLFIGFTNEEFPKIILTHQPSQIKNLEFKVKNYLGPFTDGGAVRKTLHILRGIFPYCTCQQKHSVKCLNAHMGRCLGFCCLKPSAGSRAGDRVLAIRTYRKNIRAIRAIMMGRSRTLLKELKKEIRAKIKNQDFERAGELKRQIINLDEVLKHARVLTDNHELSPAIFKDDRPNFSLLGFKHDPERLETYDISNLQGQEAVGSMVVFARQKDGSYRAQKNQYRKFKIKTVKGANDPAMIAEIITRRLNHADWPRPQLIVVDGGRSQLNAALGILANLANPRGLPRIKVVGLAKKLEEIYLPERAEPVLAQKFGQALKHLFQAMRDEAHRFALTYHRRIRSKALTPPLKKIGFAK